MVKVFNMSERKSITGILGVALLPWLERKTE